ncbi:histone-arginine methyltransferase CARMER-like isoform X1 [Pomacea canaliculata]|uniref:histone-arginine methyltransferase CARMER-like isoform X1 n=1 Tax=Pomacea canaliculata TaxID=400727 RepID=UPI000D72CB64|nr:histone-arginine methyltransferase CARMER-like isoform X1 [Pomacea canaliculata]
MASSFDNVLLSTFTDKQHFELVSNYPFRIRLSTKEGEVHVDFFNGDTHSRTVAVNKSTECARLGKQGFVITNDLGSIMLWFNSIHDVKAFKSTIKQLREGTKSVFSDRTEESSAVQYFQFYGYLSQQQNMMQDYIRTSTYQRAMLANLSDFHDKVVLDVGAGSGILSFFAIQAGARRVYAIEASSMANHCETLVKENSLDGQIIVIPGKVEEVDIPEQVDTIISEPMGYMLFNERMLESYLHAKKWLKPGGKMYPSQGDLHIAPFTDEALYMEQYTKANFWYQESFHGVNLCSLRNAAVSEYFKQPIVDTFDIRICLAKSNKFVIDFQTADEKDLHVIDIPLTFSMMQGGMIHGLAFWFEVGFLGTDYAVWLSTSPTEPLTHWYQVRCLVETPVLVKQGQTLTGHVRLRCNTRQSYDVDIEINIPGTSAKSCNTLDLKNPFFRYTGQAPQPPPGTNSGSATEQYWNNLAADFESGMSLYAGQTQTYVNGFMNGSVVDLTQTVQQPPPPQQPQQQPQQQGIIQNNLIAVSSVAPINPGSIPSVGPLGNNANANANRTSIGGGISPVNFNSTQNVICGGMGHYPVSNQFMIGDYVMPGTVLVQQQGQQPLKKQDIS